MIKKLMAIDVNMIKYDWHHLLKVNGLNASVEGLWSAVGPKLKAYGVTVGQLRVSNDGKILESKITKEQNGIVRVNCADSLDRTNLVCFFHSLQTIAEQCRLIGSTLCSSKKSAEDIPSFEGLSFSLDHLKQTYDNDLLVKLAEVYVNKGDVCATVYTNTVAMHTGALREFAQHLPAAPSNTKIIVERRIQNVLKDKYRQTSIEMFLGVNWNTYFPAHSASESGGKIRYLTPYPSYIFKTLPSEIATNKNEEYSLLRSATKYCWICPRDYDYVEVHIYLPVYCRVTELAITVRHGTSELSAPTKMDVFVGSHIDNQKMAFQEMIIPKCEDGTKLLYSLPPQISGIVQDSALYDFEGRVASSAMRIVRITFYGIPPAAFMTLGQIQVFGIQEESGKSPKKFEFELEQASSNGDINKVMEALNEAELLLAEERKKQDSPNIEEISSTTHLDEIAETEQTRNDDSDDEAQDDNEPVERNSVTKRNIETNSLFDDYFANTPNVTFNSNNGESLESFIENSIKMNNDSTESNVNQSEPASLQDLQSDIEKARQKYIKFLNTKVPKSPVNISFTDALELDLARLKLNLTPSQRDSILVEQGFKVKSFDPNSFVFYRDIEIEKVLRKRRKTNNCHLCRSSIKFKSKACRYCRYSFCNKCMAKNKLPIIEYMWGQGPVCIECANTITNQKGMIQEIQKHIELEEKKLKSNEDVYYKLFTQLHPCSCLPEVNIKDDFEETCVSIFPSAGILSSVDTDPASPPIETILLPPNILKNQYWYAPQGITSVPIIMILPCNTELSRLSLLVDRLGYQMHDAPLIKVAVADRLPNIKSIGHWDLSKITPKQQLSDNKLFISPFDRVDLKFADLICDDGSTVPTKLYNNGKCRILQLTIQLNPEKLQKGTSFLHLGRVFVYGKVNSASETELLSQEDISKYDQIMKTRPVTSRVQLQTDNSVFHREIHTLDLYVSPNPNNKSRYVSGFRICVQHGAAGIGTQVQDIRVSVLSGGDDDQKEVYHHMVGTFVVPKVAPGTNLFFDFDKTYQDIKIVRFEFLNNYRRAEKEICYGSVFLYVNTGNQ